MLGGTLTFNENFLLVFPATLVATQMYDPESTTFALSSCKAPLARILNPVLFYIPLEWFGVLKPS